MPEPAPTSSTLPDRRGQWGRTAGSHVYHQLAFDGGFKLRSHARCGRRFWVAAVTLGRATAAVPAPFRLCVDCARAAGLAR